MRSASGDEGAILIFCLVLLFVSMHSFKDVYAAISKEVQAALNEKNSTPGSGGFQAERVVISLAMAVHSRGTDGSLELLFSVPGPGEQAPAPLHTVTIEFARGLSGNHVPGRAAIENGVLPSNDSFAMADAEDLQKSLALIFGEPGFDSSARATVFREALADLSEDEIHTVLNSLGVASLPAASESVQRARHRVLRILQSGPGKSSRAGAEILPKIFAHHPAEQILQLIKDRWKTQDDWLG